MNNLIKSILMKPCETEEKLQLLDSMLDEIDMAKGIISGKYKYCPECDDYYLTKSFINDIETKKTKICIYEDPINSGGNDYTDGFVDITYETCPKGHKHEIERHERFK